MPPKDSTGRKRDAVPCSFVCFVVQRLVEQNESRRTEPRPFDYKLFYSRPKRMVTKKGTTAIGLLTQAPMPIKGVRVPL
jgi:hypothetical protein